MKPSNEGESGTRLLFCVVGLQASYLTWGYVQEKVMTREYDTGKFPSATFCVFSNRVVAIFAGMALTLWKHGTLKLPAPYHSFAPSSLANSLSSFGQYQALRYVSFPLQTLSKSTKVIPVMLMGKVLNGKSYPWVEYAEALAITVGVSMFSLSNKSGKSDATTQITGLMLLGLYIMADSFTSQYQSRVYKDYPGVDQFQMMFATNMWAICLTLTALIVSGEFWTTLAFLGQNPGAVWDNVTIAVTSATGQLFIFYTIKTFGPVVFTIIMTTRQMLSMMLSAVMFGHALGLSAYLGMTLVFATVFAKMRRDSLRRTSTVPRGVESGRASSESGALAADVELARSCSTVDAASPVNSDSAFDTIIGRQAQADAEAVDCFPDSEVDAGCRDCFPAEQPSERNLEQEEVEDSVSGLPSSSSSSAASSNAGELVKLVDGA